MRFSVIIALALVNFAAATYVPRAPAAEEAETVVARSGRQFISGPCSRDSDCSSGCCGFNTAKCASPITALVRDGGCGHGGRHGRHRLRRDMRA